MLPNGDQHRQSYSFQFDSKVSRQGHNSIYEHKTEDKAIHLERVSLTRDKVERSGRDFKIMTGRESRHPVRDGSLPLGPGHYDMFIPKMRLGLSPRLDSR